MFNKELKNQMHPRNIFKKPPDYTELAIKYRNFRQVCKLVSKTIYFFYTIPTCRYFAIFI